MCSYDPAKDCFISLGDLTDRGPHSNKVVDFFVKQKLADTNSILAIRGNHDQWAMAFLNSRLNGDGSVSYDISTQKSYAEEDHNVMAQHLSFFQNQESYRIIEYDNEDGSYTEALFVHGGINRHHYVSDQDESVFCWDRDLWLGAVAWDTMKESTKKRYPYKNKDNFKEIYVGHTPTIHWKNPKPMQKAYVHNLDTGCVFGNAYTIMDVRTKEIWQADKK